MNKLAVIVSFYKRAEITRLCFENLKKQSKKFKFDVYTCGSEGDLSQSLAKEYGFEYLEFDNNPLSKKHNALIKSTRIKDYDGIVIVGSDNFLTNSLFDFYTKLEIEQGIVYGFDDVFFFDVSKQNLYTNGIYTNHKQTIGVGRMYTKGYLESVDYNVWNGSVNSGLDSLASRQIKENEVKFSAAENKIMLLDVKHENNITNPKITNTCELVDVELLKKFGVIHKKILALKPSENSRVIPKSTSSSLTVKINKDWVNFFGCEFKTLSKSMAKKLINKNIAVKA